MKSNQPQAQQITNHVNDIDGLVQERCNTSALAMELHLSRTNPLILLQCIVFFQYHKIHAMWSERDLPRTQ